MPAALELTVDKFTFRVPTDRRYGTDGLWLRAEPDEPRRVRVGLTDFLQQRSGDAAFVKVPRAGAVIAAGETLVELETIKVTLALATPVGGTLVDVNVSLDLAPELVNQDPYGEGWLVVLEVPDAEAALGALLAPEAYLEVVRRQALAALEEP